MTDTANRTKRSTRRAMGPFGSVGKVVDEIDERFGVAKGGRILLDKIFPDHWSFMLGEIALYSFVVLIATGIFLALFFVPSAHEVIYNGTYAPLRGQRVSEAFQSTVNISFSVRGGLLIRQMHHWAADIFVGSIIVHMARIFFTGAFRKPRELNWIIGVTMLVLAVLEGFIGYSLPDDLISGTGLRIGYSIAESQPLIGSYFVSFLWGGGQFPGDGSIIPRFFIIHVLIIPIALLGLISVHLALLVLQKHTQFKGEGRTEDNVVGSPLFPTFTAKTTGFLFMITGVTALLGAFAQINPIWQFGSYDASKISYAVQPDWYMGMLDGALRIMPSWEFAGVGHTVPLEVFLPAVVFPTLLIGFWLLYPSLEKRITGDHEMHNLLDRPRDRPKRTAAGVAMFSFMFTLFAASSTDVLANFFHVSLNATLWFFRIAIFAVPIIAALMTYQLCLEMQGVHGIGKRKRAVIVSRSAQGEYSTVPSEPRPDDERIEIDPEPVPVRIDIEPLENIDVRDGGRQPETSPTGVRQVTR